MSRALPGGERWGLTGHKRLLTLVMTVGLALVAGNLIESSRMAPDGAWVAQYDQTTDPLARMLTFGDGQFFGMLAEDPTLSRPEALLVDGDANSHYAYRAMRPAYAWAAWALSCGQAALVPSVLVLLTILSLAWLYFGVRQLALAIGRDPRVATAVIVLPGVVRLLGWTGPEIAASACACFAAAAAVRNQPRRATNWLVMAVLLRETLLLVVLGLMIAGRLRMRFAIIPAAALGAWIGVLWLRLGALPAGQDRFQFGGLLEASESWNLVSWSAVAALAVLVIVASWRSPLALALAAPHLVLVVMMSEITGALDDLGRILLPLYAMLLPFVGPRVTPQPSEAPASPPLGWSRPEPAGPRSQV